MFKGFLGELPSFVLFVAMNTPLPIHSLILSAYHNALHLNQSFSLSAAPAAEPADTSPSTISVIDSQDLHFLVLLTQCDDNESPFRVNWAQSTIES